MTQPTPDKDDRPDETKDAAEGGQISELNDMAETQGGGADATDKSTGTAPNQNGEADRS